MSFEYVMSGLSYILPTMDVIKSDEFKSQSSKLIKFLNEEFPEQTFGMLFNAYKEERIGCRFRDTWGNLFPVYADSGGLQMITLGETVTDARRDEIYRVQAKYGDFCMSFDEIPLTTATKSSVNDVENRYFNYDRFKDCAKQSGVNLRTQIERFKDLKTNAKPMLIAHGNAIEHYQTWTDLLLEEVGEANIPYIGGMAFGSGSLGFGALEDFKRTYAIQRLQIPESIKSHIHILGVGSISRLLPLIAKKAAFGKTKISYDSTSHSSADSFFSYFLKDRRASYKRGQHKDLSDILVDVNQYLTRLDMGYDNDFIHKSIVNLRSELDFTVHSRVDYDTLKFAIGLFNVANFMSQIELIKKDLVNVVDLVDEKTYHLNRTFQMVNDDKDFEAWIKMVKGTVISRPVGTSNTSLEAFFE